MILFRDVWVRPLDGADSYLEANIHENSVSRMNWRSRPLTVWLYLTGAFTLGVTAFISGALILSDPSGATIGLDLEWLDGTPFQDYIVPGLFLFGILGIGSFVVIFGIGRRSLWAWWATVGLGIALVS